MADMARMRHAAPAMILALALLAVSGIAEGQTPELFSAVPPGTDAPEPLTAREVFELYARGIG